MDCNGLQSMGFDVVGGRGRSSARGVLRRCAPGVIVAALAALAPANAYATAGLGVTPSLPATVTVGATGLAGQVIVTNTNSGADVSSTVCNFGDSGACTGSQGIVLTPSCGDMDPQANCNAVGADPGVLSVSGTATGAPGTSCAGQTFTTATFGTFGKVRFTPAGGQHVVLASQGSICKIDFTFSVAKSPAVDARVSPGLQTLNSAEADAVSDQGTAAFGRSAGPAMTVRPGAPALTSTSPASPANDNQPRILGTPSPGSVYLKLYANASCTGTAFAEGSPGTLTSPGYLAPAVADDQTTSFTASALDISGASSDCSAPLAYVEDSSPPPAPSSVTSSPTGPANANELLIKGTADAGSTVRLYSDAACTAVVGGPAPAETFASPGLTVSVADDSTTTVRATATDAAGNASACSTVATYVEDSTAPQTTIGTAPTGGLSGVTVAFSSSEAGTFECRVDGGAFAACASPFTTGALAAGAHTFEVRATDQAGNTDATPAISSFTVSAGGSVTGSNTGNTTPPPPPPPPSITGASFVAPPQTGCIGIKGTSFLDTAGDDEHTGARGIDIMFGLEGDDILRGAAGNDCLYGGVGDDTLRGDAGSDRLFGGPGADELLGLAGNDRLDGDAGSDRLNGGAGTDRMSGAAGRDTLLDRAGRDTFSGGADNDTIDSRDVSAVDRRGRDQVSCGAGRDTVKADPRDIVARDCERVVKRSIGPGSL